MRFLILTMLLAAGVLATSNVKEAVYAPRRIGKRDAKVIGGAHFGWGLPMDEMYEEEVKVKEVSDKKKLKKKEPAPACEKRHRHWHLPYIEHCSDVDEAFDEVLDDEVIVEEVSSKKKLKKKELTPECEEHRMRWHLPAINHSDVEKVFESLE